MDRQLLNLIQTGELELDFNTLAIVYTMLDNQEESAVLPLFDISKSSDSFCLENFRFAKTDVYLLNEVLGIPEILRCSNRIRFKGLEGKTKLKWI